MKSLLWQIPFWYRLLRIVVNIVARVVLGFKVRGWRVVPKTGPVIVAANHRRFVDPIVVSMATPRWVKWMGKREAVRLRPFAWVLYGIGAFPVDRSGGGRAALRLSLKMLEDGEALGIFPEGGRQKEDFGHATPKSGVSMLAVRSGAPVVPVFVGNFPSVKGRLRGERLRVIVGEPFYPAKETRGSAAYQAFAREVLEKIYALDPERPVEVDQRSYDNPYDSSYELTEKSESKESGE